MNTVTRSLALGAPDAETRCVPVTLSTEMPVDRGNYTEVLCHLPGSVDMSRAPLPLIESHNQKSLNIGVVEELKLVGRTLKGMARFGKSSRAAEVFQDVLDGVVRSVSIGYEYTSPGVPVEGSDGETFRFKFRPLEVSAVAIPADTNAGFFRNKQENNMNVDHPNEDNTQDHLSRSQRRAGAHDIERERCAEITAMCAMHHIESEMVLRFVREGKSVEQTREYILGQVLVKGARATPSTYYDSIAQDDYIGMGREAQEFSIVRAINATISNDWRGAGLERAASEAVAKRIGRQSSGGFFVPRDTLQVRAPYATSAVSTGGAVVGTNLLAASFIEILRNKTRVIELGATMLTGLVGNVDVPRRTQTTPAYWVAEGANITQGEGLFDKLSLTPKTIGALSQYSRNMLIQSTPDIEMLIRLDLAGVLAVGIDLAAVAGTGVANQPLGILSTSGVSYVNGGTNGAQVSIDHLIDMATQLTLGNADVGSLAYLTNPKVLGWLSKTKTTTGQYLWERGEDGPNYAPVGGKGDALSVLGHRLAISNQVPGNLTKGTASGICSAVILGNWNDLVIGEWGILEILPNPYDSAAYKAGSVMIRAMQTIDIGVRHAASFVIMNDALTS